ncbi:PEP-CTERM sorting domain-containing protein [Maioricimonas sp. JC845]|uniref:PEP-CTERM sorting domain-containing protein n=1 Tax=Maioricimonas sp. JC845 TaxID=3232138 RepID=UPI003457F5C5
MLRAAGIPISMLLLTVCCPPAGAGLITADWSFRNVYDSTGPFGPPSRPRINDHGDVSFRNNVSGVYIVSPDGTITTIADRSDGPQVFRGAPAINNDGFAAFAAQLTPGGEKVIYAGNGGPLIQLLSQSDGPFVGIQDFFSINADTAAVRVTLDNGEIAILEVTPGGFTTVADTLPGSDYRTIGGLSDINAAGTIVFSALLQTPVRVLMSWNQGTLTQLLDTTGPFAAFRGSPLITDNGKVLFGANLDSGGEGLYILDGGTITTVVDSTSQLTGFINGALFDINNHGTVLFPATPVGGHPGLYVGPDPVRDKVIGIGDPLFGSTVTGVSIWRSLNNRNEIAFQYTLENGVTGIAVATPTPEPSSLALMGLGLAGLAAARGRRREESPPAE